MAEDRQWLARELADGISRMALLSLDRTPPNDSLQGVVVTWAQALATNRAWDQSRDAPRIRAAFARMMGTCTRWPAPATLLEHLPPAPEPKRLPPKLASHERAASALAECRALFGNPPPDPAPTLERRRGMRPLSEGARDLLKTIERGES